MSQGQSEQKVEILCNEILADPSKINGLNDVISVCISVPNQEASQKLACIRRIAQTIKAIGKGLSQEKQSAVKHTAVLGFLRQKAHLLIEIALSYIETVNDPQFDDVEVDQAELVQILTLLQGLDPTYFPQKFVTRIMLQLKLSTEYMQTLIELFQDADLIKAILKALKEQIINVRSSNPFDKDQLMSLAQFFICLPQITLIAFTTPKKGLEDKQQSMKDFKKVFQEAFLLFLSLIEPHKAVCVTLYRKLGQKIMSKLTNPLILAEYLLNKFKQEPEIQIEVLSCLFILVGKYGLEFQNFYPQLEQLIQQKKDGKSIYQLPNSKRFFKLVESALRSSKVPFKVISSTVRKIIGQIIEEQSQFAFWALAFFFNLTKKHRKLLDLIVQLPELTLLKRHYSPKIRSMVNELRKDLNKAEFLDVEQFSKINCKKITRKKVDELCRRLRSQNQAEFKIPGLFEIL